MTFPFRPVFAAIVLTTACLLASGCSSGGLSSGGEVPGNTSASMAADEGVTAMLVTAMSPARVDRAAIGDLLSAPGFTVWGTVAGPGGPPIKGQPALPSRGRLHRHPRPGGDDLPKVLIGATGFAVPLAVVPRGLAVHLNPSLVFCRSAPHPVHLMRGERELQALAAYLARGAHRLGPGYLVTARPVSRDGEEDIRVGGAAGGFLPPVPRVTLGVAAEQFGNNHWQTPRNCPVPHLGSYT